MWRMANPSDDDVSVLFNEPKLLKYGTLNTGITSSPCFSALQRAEIAEIVIQHRLKCMPIGFSALQRAEIAEIRLEIEQIAANDAMFQCSSTSRNC